MTHPEHTPASPDSPKRALAPDLRSMPERSVRAWTEPMAVEPLGSGRYRVESASGNEYTVDLPASDCTCPDHGYRGERCKHLRRVAIDVTEGRVPPPGKRRGTCAACNREAFVPEDGTPPLCPSCHLDPGDVVTDRETGDLLVVAAVTDRPADVVRIEGANCTVAEYPTNEGYPPDDLVVEVVYPFSHPRRDFSDLPRYSFPHSRLAKAEQAQLVR